MKGQLSVEMIVILAAMVVLLVSVYLLNQNLSQQWEAQRQSLAASTAARSLASAINLAYTGGNGTQVTFYSGAGRDVTRLTVAYNRSVRAYYPLGGYSSYPLVASNLNISSDIPLNRTVIIRNTNNLISAEAV